MSLEKLTIEEAAKGLKEKQFSSVELTEACLKQIEKTEPEVKAFVTVNKEHVLQEAKKADVLLEKGEGHSLTGIPASIKDVIATKEVKTTASSKILENYTPPYNATAVQKLTDIGFVNLGKNNCDEFAHGASTENSVNGPTHNPWDLSRVPGGSSGGSAATVAAFQSFYSLGTDTGGSIRQPASFCGISAIKPTYGRVSRYGLFSMTSSTDVIGPMARTVHGLAHVLETIAGKDANDSTTLDKPVPRYTEELDKASIKGLKVGVPKEYFSDALDDQVREQVEASIEWFKSQGAEIKEVSLPHTEFAVAVYYILTPSEISSNLARFDGIRYGYSVSTDDQHQQELNSLEDVYTKTRKYGFGDETKRRIMLGTYALSSGYYDAYYKQAQKVRTLIRNDFDAAFNDVDVLLTPTSPKVAFKLGAQNEDPLQMYLEDIFVAPASLAGLPALSVPCGLATPNDDDTIQLPVGLQLIAPQFEETRLLQVGHLYQQATDWHTKLPSN